MTLDEMLALLPDNDTGQIGADDLRAVVTGLWQAANTQALIFNYQYVTSTNPANGKINIDWATEATTLNVSKETADGNPLQVALIDGTSENKFLLANGDRSLLVEGTIVGASVDEGTYCTFPVTVSRVVGAEPSPNTSLNLSVFVYAEAS